MLPAPELVILGDSPVARALIVLAGPLGFRATLHAEVPQPLTRPDDTWFVVAGMGEDDEASVRDALASDAAYVGLVASRKRTAAILDALRYGGVPRETLARLKAPAGLDLGATTGPEIALSILAEIVQLRRHRAPTSEPAPAAGAMAIDPICGMTVEIATAKWTSVTNGQTFYFCAPGCKRSFEKSQAG
jgi:xanthine dehydrogenase accessory factor